ncbi:MAG: hypothetical protein WDZ59_17335 [Pirellulales bacterium]
MHVNTGFPLFLILAGLLLMGGFVLAIALAAWSKTRIFGVVLLAVLGVGLLGMMVLVPWVAIRTDRPANVVDSSADVSESFEQAQFHYGETHEPLRGMPPAPEGIEYQELPGISGGWSSSTPHVGEHPSPDVPHVDHYGSAMATYEVRHKRGSLSLLSLIVVLAAVLLIILLSRERSRGLAVGMMASICLAGVFGGAVLWFYMAARHREAARHVEVKQMAVEQAYSRHLEHRKSEAGRFDPLPPQHGLIPIYEDTVKATGPVPDGPAPTDPQIATAIANNAPEREPIAGAPPEPVAVTQAESAANIAESASADAVADSPSASVAVSEHDEATSVDAIATEVAQGETSRYASAVASGVSDTVSDDVARDVGSEPGFAAAPSPERARPAWVDASPKRIGSNAYQKTVQVGPYSTEQEIEQQLNHVLMFAVADYSRQLVGDVSALGSNYSHRTLYQAGITPAYIRQNFCIDEHTELEEKPYGTMRTAYVLMEFDQDDNRRLAARWREVRRQQGVLLASSGGLFVLSLLGVFFGYLKLDTLTKGYYSLRLKLAAVVVILGILAVGAAVFDSIT